MWLSNRTIAKGLPLFNRVTPKPKHLCPVAKKIIDVIEDISSVSDIIDGELALSDFLAERIFGKMIGTVAKPISKIMINAAESNDGIGGYSWFKPEGEINERKIEKLIVVFHDAERAGPHIDLHVGGISFIVRVPKDAVSEKFTASDRSRLLGYLRETIAAGKMIPQNLDHTDSAARTEWRNDGSYSKGYGAGPIRQIILEEPVEIITTHGKTTRIYAPCLDKDHNLFFHNLGKIVSIGRLNKESPEVKDKLHLKMTHSLKEFLGKVDPATITAKEDSAAAHLIMTPKGSTIWSPRISKETGRRIEYTGKLPEIARMKGNGKFLGELKFKRGDKYLSAAEAGGILNSDKVRPDVKPEIWLYRVDEVDGHDVSHLDFWSNRLIQMGQTNDFIKVVRLVPSDFSEGEGLVGVAPGGSVNDGYKFPFKGGTDDWKVVKNDLRYGPTGRTAGVIRFKSLSSGREFKLGPGQLGTEQFVRGLIHMDINGRVAKICSKRGHEGRASKFIEWHLDK